MSTQLANTDPEQSGDVFVFDRTPATRRVYTSQWSKWTEWAEGMGFDLLPADPKNVAGYLSYRLRAGAKVSTVRTARAAISARHRDAGHPDPTTDARVKGLLSGSARASASPAPGYGHYRQRVGPGQGHGHDSQDRAQRQV